MPGQTSVISDHSSEPLARHVASLLGSNYVRSESRIFSDGEIKIRIPDAVRGNAVIVQTTSPPVDTNLVKLLMMARKVALDGSNNICAVVPYLGYARQDRAFLEGELVSIELVSRLFEAAGISHVVTVDIHSERALSCFTIGIDNVSAIPLLAQYANTLSLNKPIIVSPDAGGSARAAHFASELNLGSFSLKKTRNRETGEISIDENMDTDVRGRDCLIVDDMISSGASIAKSASILHDKGANAIYAFCTHALLTGDAEQKLKTAGVREIIATNSVPGPCSIVDLSPTIANAVGVFLSRLA